MKLTRQDGRNCNTSNTYQSQISYKDENVPNEKCSAFDHLFLPGYQTQLIHLQWSCLHQSP